MSKGSVVRFFLLGGLVLSLGSVARAQVDTGIPPFGSFGGGPDIINLANLNAQITVPVVHKAGRGTPFTYNLGYNSSVWSPFNTSGSPAWTPAANWGWPSPMQVLTGYLNSTTTQVGTTPCSFILVNGHEEPNGWEFTTTNYVYFDPSGAPHPFTGSVTFYSGSCDKSGTNLNTVATDGSGYTLTVNGTNSTTDIGTRDGYLIYPYFIDRNGNEIYIEDNGAFVDTLGTTPLTVSGVAPNPTTFSYTAPSGASASYTMNYTSYTVATNFGISGFVEYGATATSLVSGIVLPDGTQYTFTYEATPSTPSAGACTPISGTYATNCVTGRLASVKLPTGGTISYAYSGGNNGILKDGTVPSLKRTTPDGTWTYARSESGNAWTTTVTDPLNNETILNFQGIYETERRIYQGSSSGTLLKTIFTCYNGNTNTSTCNSTAIGLPITQQSVFTEWPGGLQSRRDTFYNSAGSVTEKDEYAYGSGAPGSIVRKTLIVYAVYNLPASVTVEDGSGNVQAKTTYCYDEGTPSGTATCAATGAPTATSGTPAHVAVSDRSRRGNLTTIASVVSGSTTLGKTYTYYDTGNVLTATDVNGAATTYTYGSGTSCGNSFPTSISEPLSLSRSMVWNCTGGVATSVTDENGKAKSATYTDPDFWRPNKVTDQESNVTNMTYTGATSVEGSLDFNGSVSTSDGLTTVDSLGRTHVSQRKESPSSSTYDSVETDYDSLGRPSRKTLPYATTAGRTDSSAPGTTTTYDALSRKLTVKDSESTPRTVTFSYTQNDTYRTVGPAPSGENTKQKQFEYDALGRLTSVCEITSATGSGACAQTSAATGYWTTYTYDVNDDVTAVTQNAQSSGSQQTRTYTYDGLKRMTSENNPESGTTNYTFDTDATCGTSNGDLVKRVDAVGNTTCYAYDALHRNTSVTYSGPYSSSTPNKYFVYDAATVNGVAMANVKTRMAEAYTATSSTGTKITDIGLGYSVRGEVSDVYESTPNSGGYYHTTAAYWANGALETLGNNIATLPAFTYAPDGEGRINTVSASAGQNPLTGTTYNVAGLPTQVNLGSSDSDSFTYDPNTNRMTQYKFTVDAQSVVGTLTWNSIGTLETLAITDPFYGAGNQTCSYTHDDVSRIASANCGSPWSQTFSYDAFGNISKSGTVSFQPTYSYLTNHMTQVGSSTPVYDANGNATNDTAHTYAWDANGRPTTVDGVGLTYDALGRMAEQNKSGVYSQVVYTPLGSKFALMNGQTLTKAFVPLTGGSQAVYTSSGLTYYRHSDWIGSSRFASTPSRTMYFDGAYGPFGEPYAESGTADLSFTGMNQDTVLNVFDFPAREYNDIHGRWPSPDPAGTSAVRLQNPQTWNRYAYVNNSPLSHTDPLGMDPLAIEPRPGDPLPDPDSVGNVYADLVAYFGPMAADPNQADPTQNQNNSGCAVPMACAAPYQPNPLAEIAADLLSILGEAIGFPGLGDAGAAISVENDPSPTNMIITGLSFIPEFGPWVAGIDLAWAGAQFVTNYVLLPALQSIPGDTTGNGNGQLVPAPSSADSNWCGFVVCN